MGCRRAHGRGSLKRRMGAKRRREADEEGGRAGGARVQGVQWMTRRLCGVLDRPTCAA